MRMEKLDQKRSATVSDCLQEPEGKGHGQYMYRVKNTCHLNQWVECSLRTNNSTHCGPDVPDVRVIYHD